ncbi:hypothetical protein DPV78_003432 [Talaromyces pinophilus]|nr:hypothetical protein DPV78_003432 [Talaromyces pinophilus]
MERDQGGLVIFAGDAPSESSSYAHSHNWVKAGMEFSSDKVRLASASATSDGADGFSFPLPPNLSTNITSLRVRFERVGSSLWVWYRIPSQLPYATTPGAVQATWEKFREVTWFFHVVADKCMHVGVYASRPIRITDSDIGGGDRLVVTFEDFEILLQPSQ